MTVLLDLVTLTELEKRLGRERIMRVVAAQLANALDLVKRLVAIFPERDVPIRYEPASGVPESE